MRLSETKAAQLVESKPPKLVILDDTNGAEIVLDGEEVKMLMRALSYFGTALARRTE